MKPSLRLAGLALALYVPNGFAAQEYVFMASLNRVDGPPSLDDSVQVGGMVSGRFIVDDQRGSLSPLLIGYQGAPFVFEAQVGNYVFSATDFAVSVFDDELGAADIYGLETFAGTVVGPSMFLSGQHMALSLVGPTSTYQGSPLSTLPAEFSKYEMATIDLGNLSATVHSLTAVPEPSIELLVGCGLLTCCGFRWWTKCRPGTTGRRGTTAPRLDFES